MNVRFEVRIAEGSDFPWEHHGPTFSIGRSSDCDLSLGKSQSDVVSWEHARMELTPNGLFVHDAGSTNGTFVNGRQISQPTLLSVGDRVGIGQTGPTLKVAQINLPQTEVAAEEKPRHPRRFPPAPFGAPPEAPIAGDAGVVSPTAQPGAFAGDVSPAVPSSPGGPATVRRLVLRLQRHQRLAYIIGAAAVAMIVVTLIIALPFALQQPEEEEAAPTGSDMYALLLRSTVLIVVPIAGDPTHSAAGSGALIDLPRKLIITNYHVVEESPVVVVFFPEYRGGKAIENLVHYVNHGTKYRGKVVVKDRRRDLAVVQLERLPGSVAALPLAGKSPEPGDQVHSVGNPGASDALWVYNWGKVRQVYHLRRRFPTAGLVEAKVVETQSPLNHGDSGGPMVNDRGELVGVNQSGIGGEAAQLMSCSIDVSEVRVVLGRAPP